MNDVAIEEVDGDLSMMGVFGGVVGERKMRETKENCKVTCNLRVSLFCELFVLFVLTICLLWCLCSC